LGDDRSCRHKAAFGRGVTAVTIQDVLVNSKGGNSLPKPLACTEGLTGASEPGGTAITFATDLCLAELVDAAGQPVPAGTPSATVLIANLHNLTQPLIRYELADSFTAALGTQPGGYLRASVEGRDDGMLRYGDVSIHPHAVRTVLVSAAAVAEYQVRQTKGRPRRHRRRPRWPRPRQADRRLGQQPAPCRPARPSGHHPRRRRHRPQRGHRQGTLLHPLGNDDHASGESGSSRAPGTSEGELTRACSPTASPLRTGGCGSYALTIVTQLNRPANSTRTC
jgi:hypothetical protein